MTQGRSSTAPEARARRRIGAENGSNFLRHSRGFCAWPSSCPGVGPRDPAKPPRARMIRKAGRTAAYLAPRAPAAKAMRRPWEEEADRTAIPRPPGKVVPVGGRAVVL